MHPSKHLTSMLMLAAATGLVGVAACTLNPQPLPPTDDNDGLAAEPNQLPGTGTSADDAGGFSRSDAATPPPAPSDGGPNRDAAPPDGGEADAGDAGDATTGDSGDGG